jgi:HK97 family phage prohead protease
MKKYLSAVLKKAKDKITFVASDETLDRGGEVVPIDSWDLKNYGRNPVLLVNHDYKVENIVGKAENVRVEDKSLLFEPVFHGITQLSREVEAMVQEGILNTVSVGFMPHGPAKDGDRPTNELFEISFVPVPANPSAARLEAVMVKGLEPAVIKEVAAWAGIEEKSPTCRQADETEEECQNRKIPEIMKDDPSMDQDQAVAIAMSMCKKPCKISEGIKTEEIEEKEGRIISGKNRKLIGESIDILKQATTALDELLTATDSNIGKDSIEIQGREPKVVKVQTEKEVPHAVLRALQGINRETNDLLRKFKSK